MKNMMNGASGRHEAGRVEVHWMPMPAADGTASANVLLTAVAIDGAAAGEWVDGAPIGCPLSLAMGLDSLLVASGDRRLAEAVLDALADEAAAWREPEAVCGDPGDCDPGDGLRRVES